MMTSQYEINVVVLFILHIQSHIEICASSVRTRPERPTNHQHDPKCTIFHISSNKQVGLKGQMESFLHKKFVDKVAECNDLCAKYRSCVSALFLKSNSWRKSICYLSNDVNLCPTILLSRDWKKNENVKWYKRKPTYCIECVKEDDGVTIEVEENDGAYRSPQNGLAKSNLVHYVQNWTQISAEFELQGEEDDFDDEFEFSGEEEPARTNPKSRDTLQYLMSELKSSITPVRHTERNTADYRMRIMTLNMWRGGKNVLDGLQKIANHILFNNPDVVCLQEVYLDRIDDLLTKLGSTWTACKTTSTEKLNYIITQHEITQEYAPAKDVLNTGCRIRFSNDKEMNIWNVHLHWETYGPYAACNRGITSLVTMLYCEYRLGSGKNGRMQNLLSLINHKNFVNNLVQSEQGVPLIVAGDFNSPSHMDWINETSASHCGWEFNWPTTQTMTDYGFKDSYRETNPDPLRHPGNTWSPVVKYLEGWNMLLPEPQDRIDYIFYKGSSLRALYSTEYHGNRPLTLAPGVKENDWPSDHSAVITEFEIEI